MAITEVEENALGGGSWEYPMFTSDQTFDATSDTANQTTAFTAIQKRMLAKAHRVTFYIHAARTGTPVTTWGIKATKDGTNYFKIPGATATAPAASVSIVPIDVPINALPHNVSKFQLYVESGSNMDGSNLYAVESDETSMNVLYI